MPGRRGAGTVRSPSRRPSANRWRRPGRARPGASGLDLRRSASVARASIVWCPLAWRPIRGPTGARCRSCRWPPTGRPRPWPAVDADLDAIDAAVLGPGDAGDGDLAGGRPARTAWGCRSAAIVLIGAFLRPAALDPVRVKGVERGQLQLDQPLGGRDVAVQAGHDQPDGVAVDGRQRLPVHRRRPASRRDRRGRPRSGVPIDMPSMERRHDLVGTGLDAGLLQHGRPAGPRSSARSRRSPRRPCWRRRSA